MLTHPPSSTMPRAATLLLALLVAASAMLPLAMPGRVRAASADLFFSEYIEGSSNHKALEIYNGTGAAIDLAAGGYSVQMFFNGNTTPALTVNLAGTVADGDVFVLAQAAADPAILAAADQTNGSGWFNGDDAVVLRAGTTVIDSIGQIGVDPGTEWGTGLTSTADNTLRRKSSILGGDSNGTDAFDPAAEWDGFATNTFDGLGAHSVDAPPPPAGAVINEFSASTVGTDVEYVEVLGPASTDLSNLTILEIEGDTGSPIGSVDEVVTVGTTDAAGFWLANLPANALENGTVSLLLVEGFTGSFGQDLDTNDDGVLDATPWTALVDSVAVLDGGAGDRTYGGVALGPNYDGVSGFAPGGASRIPDGTDTDTTADWVRNDFDLAGIPGFPGSIEEGEAYNTPGEPNEAYAPPPPPPTGNCGEPATLIHLIQGDGLLSPVDGESHVVEGIVVGDFQNNASADDGNLNAFFVQEEDADADTNPLTSEGILVFAPGAIDVATGDRVRVIGTVDEFGSSGSNVTELTNVGGVLVCASGQSLPTITEVNLPVTDPTDFERYEGMLVTFPQELTISEYFNFDRFNEIVLTLGRQYQPTAVADPGSPEAEAVAEANRLGRITLDDGRTSQNSDPAIHPNGDAFDLTNLFRGGDTVANVTGVMDDAFGLYRIQPTEGADHTAANPRPASPADVGGSLTVASFNVLNYFTTIDTGAPICGPAGNQECRGADDAEELARQRAKIVAALAEIDADVVGLIEIENHPGDVPTADLVAGLNDVLGAGTYDYIETGAIGTDAIRVAMIYKPGLVTPVGEFAILDSSVDPRFVDTLSRPVLAQAFEENATGATVTIAVNHLKSKGSDCGGAPDDDPVQGNCNGTRTLAAQALVDWLAGDPTGSGDLDALIIGDLNAYDHEDPIDAIRDGADDAAGTGDDYTDLVKAFGGELAYSYLFDGQLGYLDHALASGTLASQVTGATVWQINADEPDILDYDTQFKQAAQDALYEPNAYRSSDHDPVIVGLDLLAFGLDGFSTSAGNSPAGPKAGSAIPVKFSLAGDLGLDVLYEQPQVYACGTWPLGTSVDAAFPGNSALKYDAAEDQYQFVWKTAKAFAGTCRTLEVVLDDGTVLLADFTFRR